MADLYCLQRQTQAKHHLLKHYLLRWARVLSQFGYRRLMYVDGFSFAGMYTSDEDGGPGGPGSPLIALQCFTGEGMERVEPWFLFFDKKRKYVEELKANIEAWDEKPDNARIFCRHGEFSAPINSAYSSRVSRPEWSDRAVAESALRRRGRRSGGGGRQGVDIQRSKPRWPALHPSYHSPLPLYLPSPRSGGKANMAPSPNWLSRTLSPAAPSTPCASVEGWRWKESLPYPTASLGMASR